MSLLKWDAASQAYLDEVARLRRLAEEYESRCEAYDESVCSAKSPRGAAMPANGKEFAIVNRNAKEVMAEIAARENMSISSLMATIQNHDQRE